MRDLNKGAAFQPSATHHQIKSHYLIRTKSFLGRYKEIYRHLLSKCFKKVVLGRQEMGLCKYFFWHQTEPCFLENLQTEKVFCLCFGSILSSVSKELKFVTWVKFFERTCIAKWVIFFASFYWLRYFLLQNLEWKKLWWCPLKRVS